MGNNQDYIDALRNQKRMVSFYKKSIDNSKVPDNLDVKNLCVAESCVEALQDKIDGGWLPIDSAPKDKRILVFCSETREPFVAQCMVSQVDGSEDWIFARGRNDDDQQVAMICHPDKWKSLQPPPKVGV